MLVSRTVLDVLSIRRNSVLEIRFVKEIVNDVTGVVVSQQYHRTSLQPGDDLNSTIAANSADLLKQGFTAISAPDLARMTEIVTIAHTPAVIEAFKASQKA